MKCVTNTAPISWLERIGRLELLTSVYSQICAPANVFAQLKEHYPTKDFVEAHLISLTLNDKQSKRFKRLVRRWFNKLKLDDPAEVEVFIAYKFFLDVDEMLYANKDAEEKFSPHGAVRDIADLYELAEERGIFTRADSIEYLHTLLHARPPYRTPYVRSLVDRITP